MREALLTVKDLSVDFYTARGTVHAVRNVSWSVNRGETLAILGESGSGKSVSASAVMNLLDTPPAEIVSGEIFYEGKDLLKISYEEHRALNGKKIAMIFQDPLGHLNPVYTVGWQIVEMMTAHGRPIEMARARALDLVTRVGIPEPEKALKKYPHQFSGGQRQRLMIAMALMLKPDILIADEPTTALDVTVQAAVVMGASHGRIIVRHVLPVVAPTLVTIATLDFAFVMLAESSLSFLGIGIQPPDITWGLMVSQGRPYLNTAWWLAFWPGLMIVITALSLNLLSNWMRIALDPAQRWRLESRKSTDA